MFNYKSAYQRRFEGCVVKTPHNEIFTGEDVRIFEYTDLAPNGAAHIGISVGDLLTLELYTRTESDALMKALLFAANAACLDYDVVRGKKFLGKVANVVRAITRLPENNYNPVPEDYDDVKTIETVARHLDIIELSPFNITTERSKVSIVVNWCLGVVRYKYFSTNPGMSGAQYTLWNESPIGTDWVAQFNSLGQTFEERCNMIGL